MNPSDLEELEKNFSAKILLLIGDHLDKGSPRGDSNAAFAIMESAKLMTDGIAKALVRSLANKNTCEMGPDQWQEVVRAATREAFMEATPGGPLIKMGNNLSFVTAVAECTAAILAPRDSEWAQTLAKREEKAWRMKLKSMGLPPKETERLMEQWRSLKDSNPGI